MSRSIEVTHVHTHVASGSGSCLFFCCLSIWRKPPALMFFFFGRQIIRSQYISVSGWDMQPGWDKSTLSLSDTDSVRGWRHTEHHNSSLPLQTYTEDPREAWFEMKCTEAKLLENQHWTTRQDRLTFSFMICFVGKTSFSLLIYILIKWSNTILAS